MICFFLTDFKAGIITDGRVFSGSEKLKTSSGIELLITAYGDIELAVKH
jgi:hypothetical protein